MKYLRSFISGMIFPSLLLPFILLLLAAFGKTQVLAMPFVHFVPLLWGVWNVLYFAYFSKMLPRDLATRLYITGAVLGLLLALYAVFGLKIPELLGFPPAFTYLPLIGAPILYALVWRFIVQPLNRMLGVSEEDFN